MELAVGTMGTLAPKLLRLLEDEFVTQMGIRREVECLCRELPMMDAALVEVSRVPPEQLCETDKIWAQQVRELSYEMEDAVDAFMVRVARRETTTDASNIFKKIARKITAAMKKVKDRHQISDKIKDIKALSKELSELRARYKFSGAVHAANTCGVDPRVINLNKNEGRELVGIEKARDELLQMLRYPEGHNSLKVISIVGCGGLGKTSLAKVVHDYLKAQPFDCCASISVGRNPSITNILREMLEKLGQKCRSDMESWRAERFCEVLHEFLQGKRYNIVVDDVWEKRTWESINCALPDSNCGSIVIITTRNYEVCTKSTDVYRLKPLSHDNSKELFFKRTPRGSGDNQLVDKIIDKCDGVPLAIIAIASLLADRLLEDWQTVYDSLIFGCEEGNTRTILLYSYYDLPPYLKPCLLYLSMYQEDHLIEKSTLIWRWIAEGFVQLQKEGCSSIFEVGDRYFNELLNRSMIQPVEEERAGFVDGCRVHDVVLDLIRDLSTEENFVTTWGEKQFLSLVTVTKNKEAGLHGLARKVRRLSIQWSNTNAKRIPRDAIGMLESVRSLHTTDCLIDTPLLSSFQACRVLSVAGVSDIGDLKHMGKLLHLRYLEISGHGCYYDELPKEIENAKSLQTLILSDTLIRELPPEVCELTQLMCLHAPRSSITKVPADGIGSLVCLEELKLRIKEDVDDFVVELGKLTRLRVIDIDFLCDVNETCYRALMQSLNNLQEIRELVLWTYAGIISMVVSPWESWRPPRQLWSLVTNMGLSLQIMDPSRFRSVRYLSLSIQDLEADIGNLALLPELVSLILLNYDGQHQGFIVDTEGFKNLRVCEVQTKFKFLQGAMPRLESLCFQVHPGRDPILDFEEINLENLVSIMEVILWVDCSDSFRGEVEEAEAVVTRAVKHHPNRPTHRISRFREHAMLPDEDVKPDKVVHVTVNVRDCRRDKRNRICDDVNMRYYRWLEKITCDIDCEGSRLDVVKELEASLRSQAARHPKRPRLVMTRINEDKKVPG